MVNNRVGRPAGTPLARERLLDAARFHFARGDLVDVSSRDLAAEAGVSHTLVNYHFGSRDGLIAAVVALAAAPHDVIALSRGEDGRIDPRRLAHGILATWEHPEHGARLARLAARAASGDRLSTTITDYLQNAVLAAIVDDFGRERGHRMSVAVVGFIFGRYVLRLPMFAALSREDAGRLLQSMLG